jgi:hypothetical protein
VGRGKWEGDEGDEVVEWLRMLGECVEGDVLRVVGGMGPGEGDMGGT